MSCIGIICALTAEANCLTGKTIPANTPVQIDEHRIVIISGMGEANASVAAQALIKKGVSALISWGTAGALTEKLRSGDLFLADSIVSSELNNLSFDAEWNKHIVNVLSHTPLRIHHGLLAHSQQVMTSVEYKNNLHNQTNALAVDMESFAIAQLANAAALPCISIRAIVDDSSQCIPETVTDNTDIFGHPIMLSLLYNLIKNPRLAGDLIKLGKGMSAATKTLKIVASSQALSRAS